MMLRRTNIGPARSEKVRLGIDCGSAISKGAPKWGVTEYLVVDDGHVKRILLEFSHC